MTPDELRARLAALGMSGAALARALRVDPRTVRRWEAGEVDVPYSVQMLLRGETLEPAGPDNAKRKDG